MMEIIINEENINEGNIEDKKEKVRAIIVTEDNKILTGNYGGVLLLPGGKIDTNETLDEAIIRELNEELGTEYKKEELEYFLTITFYQNNYPSRNDSTHNRKVTTHYFLTHFKGIIKSNQKLTDKEKKDKFYLELLSLEELKNKLQEPSDNPRSMYFNKELNIIIANYLKQGSTKITTKNLKKNIKRKVKSL